MEEDQLPLQVLVDKFERGAKLHQDCETFLSSAKKRLEIIATDTKEKSSDTAPQSPSNDDDEIRLF
jgi:exodeoxyribonuclease VII small subunit